ncbi:unnamed protein product [Rotaria sordida]|uniref:G-protein coupled receptors family 1 profile domain-containing protein n=1 Tax=Rotaria sordida TaxID=392033 RepID=A0A819DXU2_9BILA|nr:unnamed protein product [Rotaria sordida]CAF0762627.1 unnamed protein product [Rotaria sordida]CAF0791225.1 unnamed protein product [Rotaria sordida]CAF3488516.1 unnamed protein product [Rotaria sordida]CAF3841189.1 unnamed protein product [Rotaria sordida]
MATTTPILTSNTISSDEILSESSLTPTNDTNKSEIDKFITNFLLIIFPLYICAILLNFLSIYSILMAKIYRQYLSNVLLAVICIGALINLHGLMFLILLRWTNTSSSTQLCSSSLYVRDNGSILIYTHVLLLAFERILANLKKHPTNLNNKRIQNAHLFLIVMSLISIILSLTVPIYTLTRSSFSSINGLCTPDEIESYKKYLHWIYYGFGHSFVWSSCILLTIFLIRKTTISYSTLIPMNRIILIISFSTCINLLISTLFDDIIGIGDKKILDTLDGSSITTIFLMNLRDFISIIDKILIGLLFFLFRPEIRLWLYESMKKFQLNKNETIIPQRLEIHNVIDDNYYETDDGQLHPPADI